MLIQFPSPAIIAHRGDNAHAPENTLSAFKLALEKQADGIELDVHLSADGKIVVIHDARLERTTNGKGHVGDYTADQLRQLDAGDGEPVPLLEEVLELLDKDTILNIELKGKDKNLSAAVVQLVADHHKEKQVIYSSFNPELLSEVKKIAPDAAIGLLLQPGFIGKISKMISEPRLNPWSLHPHFSSITNKFMKKAKRNNRRVFTYTVDRPKDVKHIFKMGVDGIITNDPQTAVRLRSEIQ